MRSGTHGATSTALENALATPAPQEVETRIGDRVRFHPSSVFLTPPEEPIVSASDADLEGTVVACSDSGSKSQVFAVVEVVRKQAVVVPVSELQIVSANGGNFER